MDETETEPGLLQKARLSMRGLAPAMPAAIGASALTLLFAAVMPMAWVRGIAWNLYLDRLGAWFEPPVGDAGRLALAAALALLAGLIAAMIALVMAKPVVDDDEWMDAGFATAAGPQDDSGSTVISRRRRVDMHPDAPPRPPIRAASDLPAAGLGPVPLEVDETAFELTDPDTAFDDDVEDDMLELSLTELAPETDELLLGEEASAEIGPTAAAAIVLPPDDGSLGAMVTRFEAGLDRRRQQRAQDAGRGALDMAANEADEPVIDFALEAALSTLQRMQRSALG